MGGECDLNDKLLIILTGVPGSGKSTISARLAERMNGTRISTDALKGLIYNRDVNTDELELLFDIQHYIFEKIMDTGGAIISDSNSAKEWQRDKLKTLASKHGYRAKVIFVSAPKEVIRERLLQRAKEDVINRDAILDFEQYYEELDFPQTAMEINTIEPLNYNIEKIMRWLNE